MRRVSPDSAHHVPGHLRRYTCPLRNPIYGIGDLIGYDVMDHVPSTGHQLEVAAGDPLVELPGMALMIHDPVPGAGHDRDRSIIKIAHPVSHSDHARHHRDGVLGLGTDLRRPPL
jgi:hypothetical protein